MENIYNAANSLYKELKQYKDFAGTAIIGESDKQSIMLCLVEETSEMLNAIPLTYKGFPVCYEVTGEFKML